MHRKACGLQSHVRHRKKTSAFLQGAKEGRDARVAKRRRSKNELLHQSSIVNKTVHNETIIVLSTLKAVFRYSWDRVYQGIMSIYSWIGAKLVNFTYYFVFSHSKKCGQKKIGNQRARAIERERERWTALRWGRLYALICADS